MWPLKSLLFQPAALQMLTRICQGANVCQEDEPDAHRMIYGYFGVRDTLRQGETATLAVPPELAQTMPPEVLRLVVSDQ